MFNTFFLLHRLTYKVLCQKYIEKLPPQRTSKDNSRNIANSVICFHILKFSKENCFTLSFYCTVLCAGRSTKEGLNHLLHRPCLRKNQETLQILVFSLILLNLFKNVSYFLFIALPYVQSASNHLIHCPRLRKNQDTLKILIFGLIIVNLVKKLFYNFLFLHCAMYRVPKRQLPSQIMLKYLGYISKLSIFHTMLLNL